MEKHSMGPSMGAEHPGDRAPMDPRVPRSPNSEGTERYLQMKSTGSVGCSSGRTKEAAKLIRPPVPGCQ